MARRLANLFRHPLKGFGEEALGEAELVPGRPLAFDRIWAIAHGASAFDPEKPEWVIPRSFVTQTRSPKLAQVRIACDEAAGRLRLSHPDLPDLQVAPDDEGDALTEWMTPLAGVVQKPPFRLAALPGPASDRQAFLDFEEAHISIASHASLQALSDLAGAPLETVRFRMNLWLEGGGPWEEFDWIGREIRVGETVLKVYARDDRCAATTANPATGETDIQVPAILRQHFGHKDFGVYAQVVTGGRIRIGDEVEPL